MSSYYSQRVQYKSFPHNTNRSNTVNGDSHIDDVKYTTTTTPSSTKKMAALTSSYTVQKAGGSSSASTYVASDYIAGNGAVKLEMESTPSKISTHLLDHGYGATPQPAYGSDETAFKGCTKSADSGITNYYKVSIDWRCSKWWGGRVCSDIFINHVSMSFSFLFRNAKAVKRRITTTSSMSPPPAKQAKHAPPKASSSAKKRYSEGTRYVLCPFINRHPTPAVHSTPYTMAFINNTAMRSFHPPDTTHHWVCWRKSSWTCCKNRRMAALT